MTTFTKQEILDLPIGKFADLKPQTVPYRLLRYLFEKIEDESFYRFEHKPWENRDDIFVKDIINLSPSFIVEKLDKIHSQLGLDTYVKNTTLRSLKIVREKLLKADFSEKKYPFLQSPYSLTYSSPKEEWEKLWTGSYGLTKSESKKLTQLLSKVNHTVPQRVSNPRR